jgi:alginate O-acetyltransferase complex protein AlgJ
LAEEFLPSGGRSREEIAKIEIGVTNISRATASLLTVTFLVLVFLVPAIELIAGHTDDGATTTWSHLSGIPSAIRERLAAAHASPGDTLWQRTLAVNRGVLSGLQDFEQGLERESRLGQTLRPHAQLLLTRWLGAGNERAYPGRHGWVFYRPDVEYVTGPGFLDPAELRRRIASAPEWTAPPQPDPRPALLQFKRDLDARGIALVVVPTPVKPVIHPEMLAARLTSATGPIHNASYASFIADLEREGVRVFDPSAVLVAERRTTPQYLAADTHWRPEAMEAAAEALAGFIAARVRLPVVPEPGYRLERSELRYEGDTARMLDLPATSMLYPPDQIWPAHVRQRDGSPWRVSRGSDVLVLGDSFTNIYAGGVSDPGSSAGFSEHLSYALARPLDRIVQDGSGAFATREMLQRDYGRLAGKRLVVYQFAVRELTIGDWKIIRFAPEATATSTAR